MAASAAVEIAGFMDYRYDDAENTEGQFQFRPGNGVELSLSSELSPHVTAQATIVSGGGGFTLGPSFVDWNIKAAGEHDVHGAMVDHSGIQAGLFDVPFGIESRYYSSVDRPTVSAPFLTARLLGGGWTDYGFHAYFSNQCGEEECPGPFTLDLYGVTGLQWNDGADAILGTLDDGLVTVPLTAFSNGRTLGGRFGFSVTDGLELGGSYARGDYHANIGGMDPGMTLTGLDVTLSHGALAVRGEYATFSGEIPAGPDREIKTWYIEATYEWTDRLTPVIRYDEIMFEFDRDGDGLRNDGLKAWLGGIKYALTDNLALRAEYQIYHYQKPGFQVSSARDHGFRASAVAEF